jgi:hypothetical protein
MNMERINQLTARRIPNSGRPVLGAVLLVALVLAVFAGSALAASLVKNGSFEKDGNGDGLPNKWLELNLTAGDKRVCNQSASGQCSFKMVGNGIADGPTKIFFQIVPVSGLDGDQYSLSFWTKGKEIVFGSGGFATVFVQFNWVGGGNNSHFFNIPSGTSAWTLGNIPDAEALADYSSISVSLEFDADSGKVWFDKVKLVEVP